MDLITLISATLSDTEREENSAVHPHFPPVHLRVWGSCINSSE